MPKPINTIVLVLACLVMLAERAEAAQRSTKRVFRGPESILARACLEQGDLDGDQRLTQPEWQTLITGWKTALGFDEQERLSRPEFLKTWEALLDTQDHNSSTASNGMLPSRFLGFFVALDTNQDGWLSALEFRDCMTRWFEAWQQGHVSLDATLLQASWLKVLPMSNMSGAGMSHEQTALRNLPPAEPSPPLSPQDSMDKLVLPQGYRVKLAAHEPMIQDPVAMSFDSQGRLYVVEMRSFMLDIDGRDERSPISRISRLVDQDGDGVMDIATVYLDQLVLPRAVLALAEGLLYVDDYRLMHAMDTDDDGVADLVRLIDDDYGRSNIEHAPNALMPAMDNWIYNGRSPWRYRCLDGHWVKEATELRGQWGMTQDDHGRLFYNVNNSQLLGDLSPPNYMSRHSSFPSTAGLNMFIATDQQVHTLRMNTAVNRGYLPDVLDEAGRLHVFASSCSPLIYRGDQFPEDAQGNAFVCDPAANLIKRNLITEKPLELKATPAYPDREFLASTDERFRPVALAHGPDGALWVLDMYRGIAQYGMFMTDYLRQESLKRGLDQGIHLGRLYRITHEGTPLRRPKPLSEQSPLEWVDALIHHDGWIRDTAQRQLIAQKDLKVLDKLLSLIENTPSGPGAEHALWTLEGLLVTLSQQAPKPHGKSASLKTVDSRFAFRVDSLPPRVWQVVMDATRHKDSKVRVAAIRVGESLARSHPNHAQELARSLLKLATQAEQEVLFQIILSLGNLPWQEDLEALIELASLASEHWLLREALISSLDGHEWDLLSHWLGPKTIQVPMPHHSLLIRSLSEAIASRHDTTDLLGMIEFLAASRDPENWKMAIMLHGIKRSFERRGNHRVLLSRSPFASTPDDSLGLQWIDPLHEALDPYITWPGHPSFAQAVSQSNAPSAMSVSNQETHPAAGNYQMACGGCHGMDGLGLAAQAPPLRQSEWVTGSLDRLIRIVLQGAQGPIHVRGKRYAVPEILAEMPPLSALDNAMLASILTYIRQSWGHEASAITPRDVGLIRQATHPRQTPWTESELNLIP